MSALKDVLLVGLGGVGAIYSLVLKQSGLARVTVVARSNYEAVKAHGMHIKSQKYGDFSGWRPDRLCSSVAEAADRPYSHVLVTTKTVPEILKTSDLLAPFLSSDYTTKYPQPTYVLMQNGLGLESALYDALKLSVKESEEPRVIGSSLYIGTRLTEKNAVEHSYFDRCSFGIYRPTPNILTNTPEEEAVLNEFGDMLKAGGSDVVIVPEIQRVKFEKNIWNCLFGPVTTLARHSLQAIFRAPHIVSGKEPPAPVPSDSNSETPSQTATSHIPASYPIVHKHTIPFLYDTLIELATLGNALFPPTDQGPVFDPPALAKDVLERTGVIATKPTSTERPSILVDVENGRPMELEVIVGEVVRLGRKAGVPLPRIEGFYALMLIIQSQLLARRDGPTQP